jgi:hypothetical protein
MQALLGDNDSDDDTYFDRTGDVEKNRLKKELKNAKKEVRTDTFDTLRERRDELGKKEVELEAKLTSLTRTGKSNSLFRNSKRLKQHRRGTARWRR